MNDYIQIKIYNDLKYGAICLEPKISQSLQSSYHYQLQENRFVIILDGEFENKQGISIGDSCVAYGINEDISCEIKEVSLINKKIQLTLNQELFESGLLKIKRKGKIYFQSISRKDGWVYKEFLPQDKAIKYFDSLIEQGKNYKYDIGIYFGEEIINFLINYTADFEDIFLSDGSEQFRILYNPKVSSFKTIIAEQKIDTIGGRFPLFVRNGNLNYKEIPLSGLIVDTPKSLLEPQRTMTPAPDFVNETIAEKFINERENKIEIEKWLRNGQPKLFRSPAEGNYIIRLMNVSLSPENKLSRMLHSFSATGYEIMEYNKENILNNFLDFSFIEREGE